MNKQHILKQMRAVIWTSQHSDYTANANDMDIVANLNDEEFPLIWHCSRNAMQSWIYPLNRKFTDFKNGGKSYSNYAKNGEYPYQFIWDYDYEDLYFIIDRNGLQCKQAYELETIIHKMFDPIIAQMN